MADELITTLSGAARERRVAWLCQAYAHLFRRACPGDEGRYVAEGWIPGATPADWDCAYSYIGAHPELFDSRRWPHRDQAVTAECDRENADRLRSEAAAAFRAGDHALALAMIDDAEWFGGAAGAGRIRAVITAAMTAAPSP